MKNYMMKNYVIGVDDDGREFVWWPDPNDAWLPTKPRLPEPDFTLEEIEQASEQISSTD